MGQAIEELAHFIACTPWEAIPKSVREHAKLVVLDTVGVILAGSVQPEVAGVRARLTATGDQTRPPLRRGPVLNLTPGYAQAVDFATALIVAGGRRGFPGALAPELAL